MVQHEGGGQDIYQRTSVYGGSSLARGTIARQRSMRLRYSSGNSDSRYCSSSLGAPSSLQGTPVRVSSGAQHSVLRLNHDFFPLPCCTLPS